MHRLPHDLINELNLHYWFVALDGDASPTCPQVKSSQFEPLACTSQAYHWSIRKSLGAGLICSFRQGIWTVVVHDRSCNDLTFMLHIVAFKHRGILRNISFR